MRNVFKWAAILLLPSLALCIFGAHGHTLAGGALGLGLGIKGLALMGATNTLGNYDETFFAQEALIQLEKALGMASRVYKGYNPNPQVKGDTIQVRRPSYFSAQAAPSSDQNITTDSVAITVNKWEEVKFSLTDKDLALTSDKIISDHIRPAAVALADKIDQDLAALYLDVPWYSVNSATPALADITKLKKIMFDNKVPMKDQSLLHLMIGSNEDMSYQNAMTVLANPQAAGLRSGDLGNLYGFDTFANQNTPSHVSGVSVDFTGALTAATAVGDSTIAINAIDAAGTVTAGDIVTITGDPQQYVVTAGATASSGAIAALAIEPKIKQINASGAVVTLYLGGQGVAKAQNLAFHTNAFCLATAPLSDIGNQLGARIATISDPITGLSLRSRLFYIGDSSTVKVALDVLYGVKTLDGNLAVRGYAA